MTVCGRRLEHVTLFISRGDDEFQSRWHDHDKVGFCSGISTIFHSLIDVSSASERRIESSPERSITHGAPSVRHVVPPLHLAISSLSPSVRPPSEVVKKGRKDGSHSPAHFDGHELYKGVVIGQGRSEYLIQASMQDARGGESSPKYASYDDMTMTTIYQSVCFGQCGDLGRNLILFEMQSRYFHQQR